MQAPDPAARRLRKRRRAEVRLKFYGILAICFAGAALIALMSTIVGKAAGAMTESYMHLDAHLEASEIDPTGHRDPAAIGAANYDGLVKSALRAEFPSATHRADKRALYNLVSSGASFELRQTVLDDPAMIGTNIDARLLASDDADLYLKGYMGRPEAQQTAGTLTPSATKGEIELVSSAADFAPQLAILRAALADTARRLRRNADLQGNAVAVYARRAKAAETEAARAKAAANLAAAEGKRDGLIARAEALEVRSNAHDGGDESLNAQTFSVLVRINGGYVKATSLSANRLRGKTIIPLASTDPAPVGGWDLLTLKTPEAKRTINDRQAVWLEALEARGQTERTFNWRFFTAGDSREAELAGIWGAVAGSFWTMLTTFLLAFPVGVLAAIYLEEFAPRNRATDFIEVNINNLAAVPSIVFGLLGLAVFLQFFGVPRSAPLAGGMVLALMTLPTVIIAGRAAIKSVPSSIRNAALGLGASRVQATFHHVLPLAMPGILTGAILGMARALGETAPLIMIGMVAFIIDIPGGITDNATVLPVQVFRWTDFPERAFEMRTAAAIMVLLLFLIVMNGLAVLLRKRFERRW